MIDCYMSKKEILKHTNHTDIIKEAESARERVYESISSKLGFEKEDKRKVLLTKQYCRSVAASVLVLLGLGFLIYQSGSGVDGLVNENLEAHSSNGSLLEIFLPDSTKVILNSGSTLQYPSCFSMDQRVVKLNGEAFFDVAKDSSKPFIIQARGMEVKVLGTRFNLKSFEEENVVQLTLEEGAVLARTGLGAEKQEVSLVPGDQVVLNKTTGEITNRKVNTRIYTSWFTGDMYFQNHTLEEIAEQLEKKFNVKIIIADESIKQDTFYCQFNKDHSLKRIMQLLAQKSNWEYRINGDSIEIFR